MTKHPKELADLILSYRESGHKWRDVSKMCNQHGHDTTHNSVKLIYNRYLKNDETNYKHKHNRQHLSLQSSENNSYTFNDTTETVITDLGEYGDYVCSYNQHSAIQRDYSNLIGTPLNQEQIARKYNFSGARAVSKYMQIHGIRHSSLPQTDLEITQGLEEEEAIEENISSWKRKVQRDTQKKKWQLQQKYANKWMFFRDEVVKPFEDYIEEYLPKHKVPKLNLPKTDFKFSVVIGLSDLHYMKLCYDADGNVIYNKEIAKQKLKQHLQQLVVNISKFGLPEKIYICVGSDNLHIDNILQTTTKGTTQADQTDGSYKHSLSSYLDINMHTIDYLSQVAPVEVIGIEGNHDRNTSMILSVCIQRIYRDRKDVNVHVKYSPRIYLQYENNCLIFTHGDGMSQGKLKNQTHKFIMTEAKEQGINISKVDNYIIFSQHVHHDSQTDIGGNVIFCTLPSISPPDTWHKEKGFVGSREEFSGYIIDEKKGRKGIIYS